ncbi:MAG: glycosyltransferase family 39 protein [Herminiimonas sp.]|nr:glycosyltransferase family 39 protein [Herminiimonas sp.]
MSDLRRSKPLVLVLLLAFCFAWFYVLDARTLVPTDEGRYAEMAREMAATNDWITPRLNGIKYFEKPPLQTWMNALTFKAFGLGEWQARLWTGLCGLFGVALVGYTGRRVFNRRAGFTAAAVLASSFYWTAMSQMNTLDMGLAAMMTLALCGLLLGQRNGAAPRQRRKWMLACWAGMALAVLSKGLIGVVLPGAVLVLYMLLARDRAIWKRLYFGPGLLVFFTIAAPWFVLVSLANPEFPSFFFIHEHLQRFTSTVHHRAGPWHYFIPFLLLGIVPWLGVLAQSLWAARRREGDGFQPKTLLLIWAGFIFCFFSISGSKLPSYILPIFPALALLIACYLEQASHKAVIASAGVLALLGAVGLVYLPNMPPMGRDPFSAPLYAGYAQWGIAAAGIALAGSLASIGLARHRKQLAILLLAGSSVAGSLLLLLGHEPFGRYSSGIAYVPAIRAELTPQTPLYAVGRYEQVLPFYLERTMTLVEHADEMEFGVKQQPHLWIPTREAFIEQWTADRSAGKKSLAILGPVVYEDFLKLGVPMRVIAKDPRRAIVANDPVPANDPSRTATTR